MVAQLNAEWARALQKRKSPPSEWTREDKEKLFRAYIVAGDRKKRQAITNMVWPDGIDAIPENVDSEYKPYDGVYEDDLLTPESSDNEYTAARQGFYSSSNGLLWRIFKILYAYQPATDVARPSGAAGPSGASGAPGPASEDSDAEFRRRQIIQKVKGWLTYYQDDPVRQRRAASIIQERGENTANALETYSDDTLNALRAYLSRKGKINKRDLDAWRDWIQEEGDDHKWSKRDVEFLREIQGKRRQQGNNRAYDESMKILKGAQEVEDDFEIEWDLSKLDHGTLWAVFNALTEKPLLGPPRPPRPPAAQGLGKGQLRIAGPDAEGTDASVDTSRNWTEIYKAARRRDFRARFPDLDIGCIHKWNKYAEQYCVTEEDVDVPQANEHCRREFCDGLSSKGLMEKLKNDPHMEFATPAQYAARQTLRGTKSDEYQWPYAHLPPRLYEPTPGKTFGRGPDNDHSFGWASLASWYYPRHESIIEGAWQAYDQFKYENRGRPLRVVRSELTGTSRIEPFVKTATYRALQARSDDLDMTLAPMRYKQIRYGLDVVALFLGNGTQMNTDALERFCFAVKQPINAPPIDETLVDLETCDRRDPPVYYDRRPDEARYMPLFDFLEAVFKDFPASGGPNYDAGIRATWSHSTFHKYEGEFAKRKKWNDLSKGEQVLQDTFDRKLSERRGELDFTLRVMGGLCLPTKEDDLPTKKDKNMDETWPGAHRLLEQLWHFLIVDAWPVYRRFKAAEARNVPFASVEAHHKRWFREVHYDEYDRWAHQKWEGTDVTKQFQEVRFKGQLPDLYTLMKRRHKIVIERDECREDEYARLRVGGVYEDYAAERANYARAYETDFAEDGRGRDTNVRRPTSGGRSYGAGAYRALKYDPYCTFGRQRAANFKVTGVTNPTSKTFLTPAEKPYDDWDELQRTLYDLGGCMHCGDAYEPEPKIGDRFPPRRPPPRDRASQGLGKGTGGVKRIAVTNTMRSSKRRVQQDDEEFSFLSEPLSSVTPYTRLRRRLNSILLRGHRQRRSAEGPRPSPFDPLAGV